MLPVSSETVPEILPVADCARTRAGTHRSDAARKSTFTRMQNLRRGREGLRAFQVRERSPRCEAMSTDLGRSEGRQVGESAGGQVGRSAGRQVGQVGRSAGRVGAAASAAVLVFSEKGEQAIRDGVFGLLVDGN